MVAVSVEHVGTATTAVNITTEWELLFFVLSAHGSVLGSCATDGTAVDVDFSLHIDVAVFTSAIHGALNGRTCRTNFTDIDLSIGCKRQAIEESTNRINLTTA